MIRRLFNIAAATSLLLCVGAMVVWACSFWSGGFGGLHQGIYSAGQYTIGTRANTLFLHLQPYPRAFVVSTTVGGKTVAASSPVPIMGNDTLISRRHSASFLHGVSWSEEFISIPMSAGPPTRQVVWREIEVSFWLACALLALPPVLWMAHRSRRRPDRGGVCPRCGYDLCASRDRCPECGTPVPVAGQ